MKPALTHLLAAAAGGLLIFLIVTGQRNPAPAPENAPPTKPAAGSSPSSSQRTAASPRDSRGDEPSSLSLEAIEKKLGAVNPDRAKLMDYIAAQDGDPEAIMAAGLILKDTALLKEAVEKDPANPQPLMALVAHGTGTPEENLAWRKRLVALEPGNAFASYLLASQLRKSGDTAALFDTLRRAATQPDLEDYSHHNMIALEEAYRGTGSSDLGARAQGSFMLAVPHISEVLNLAQSLQEDRASLSPEDAEESRNISAGMGVRMTRDLPYQTLLSEIVGLAVQRESLEGLADDAPSPFEGLTATEANASLESRLAELRNIDIPNMEIFLEYPPDVLEAYLDRTRELGEVQAMQWLSRRMSSQDRN